MCMNETDKRKQQLEMWNELPLPRVSWETFKRLCQRNRSITAAVQQAIKIATKEQS
jgi:hypothetical protein